MVSLPSTYQQSIDRLQSQLPALLGENLYSCILYGSCVRGNVVPGVSDINILLILNESTSNAHAAIAECLDEKVHVDLFIIGRKGMERSFQSFAIKFRSIKRNYKLLHGTDPMESVSATDERLRFLSEQSLRNLRLRCVHSFIYHRKDRKRYLRYLLNVYTPLFTGITEVLRCDDIDIPRDYAERIPVIEKYFSLDVSILADLLRFKIQPDSFSSEDIKSIHNRLFTMLNEMVIWIEQKWPPLT